MNETHVSVEQFDLTRHFVVEASAGTGKTYTIEQLFLRLLKEFDVTIDQILVVTFTEKATGELKTRLRAILERAIQDGGEHSATLKIARDQFDQAAIFTIHGFCQRLLRDYALEQSQDLTLSLVDDVDLLQTGLREIQRKNWRTIFGPRLKAVLEAAGYHRNSAAEWDKKVLEIAKRYKPRCGHQFRPEFVPDWHQRINEAGANWIGQLEIFTINLLHEYLRTYKRERGLHSFDDMIASVEESLDPTVNADATRFAETLRQRYRFGIVDEFQDTDPLQWRIFRRIFLDGGAGASDNRLFLVGDPKQAIFTFRGADLPTYLQAAEEMKSKHEACDYPLDTNWRSHPDLLEALNSLFAGGEWFPRAAGIRYVPVHAPDADQLRMDIQNDLSNRPALSMVDLGHCTTLTIAKKQYARFVAHEIQMLLDESQGPRMLISQKKSPPRPLNAGDFCILVMKRAEAEPITQALDIAGIPYSFYKESGLWRSDEAVHVEVLLQALAKPEEPASFRKALLTCFFRITPEAIARCPDVPTHHPARQRFQAWLGFAENRQWSALFHSMLEDTGLLFSDVDRRITNLRQILTTLEQIGHSGNYDLLGLIYRFQERRLLNNKGESEMPPADLAKPRVKIMTIHASKGLEFPIVFLAGGFTKGPAGNSISYRDENGRIVFDLGGETDGEVKDRIGAETLSEQRRLLYVALTRPIFKLYVPRIKRPKSSQWLGPVGTILLPALEQSCPERNSPLIADFVKTPIGPVSLMPPEEAHKPPANVPPPLMIEGPLFPSLDPNLGKRRIVIRSFSSMTRHHLTQVGAGSNFGEQPLRKAEEDSSPTQERDDPLRGPVFGDMVHNVLEQIDFAEVARGAIDHDLIAPGTHARKLIDAEIRANLSKLRTRSPRAQLEQACRTQIAEHVWNALRTPLASLGKPLCAIPAPDRLHEVEFQYPEQMGEKASARIRWEDGYISGFIDLVFRHEEKYYLVDFKTNLLAGYSQEQIQRCMDESDYHRQYQLYLQALKRWLERMHGPKFAFQASFGGVYYLFVRGMNAQDQSAGVFFLSPSEQDLDLRRVLSR